MRGEGYGRTLPAASVFLLGFARFVRAAGFAVAPEQVVALLDAVRLLGPRSMDDIRQAALATLGPSPERLDEFDALFRAWFWGDTAAIVEGTGEDETSVTDDGGDRRQVALPDEQVEGGAWASAAERLAARSFDPEHHLAAFGRALPGALPTRRSMRSVRAARGRPALRRALRSIVGGAGDVPRPPMRRALHLQRRVLLLIDISGSMKAHAASHLELAHAVVRHADRAEVFTLGTRLTRITAALRIADRSLALARVAETVEDWDGGTRIGPTLLALLSIPRFAAFARGACVVVLSDGLERGGHAEMEQAFRRLRARAFRLSMLTPLAADPRYRPRTAAVAAILPWLDDLADGSGLAPLTDFILSLARSAPADRRAWREAA